MMEKNRAIIVTLIVAVVLLVASIYDAMADDVKHCINPFTQEIIAVPAGMPCPYPTHEA